jgi:hypothetical protein
VQHHDLAAFPRQSANPSEGAPVIEIKNIDPTRPFTQLQEADPGLAP